MQGAKGFAQTMGVTRNPLKLAACTQSDKGTMTLSRGGEGLPARARTQDARGDAVRVEGLERLQLLASAHELDGLPRHRLHAQRRAAAAVAVHLCEHRAWTGAEGYG